MSPSKRYESKSEDTTWYKPLVYTRPTRTVFPNQKRLAATQVQKETELGKNKAHNRRIMNIRASLLPEPTSLVPGRDID